MQLEILRIVGDNFYTAIVGQNDSPSKTGAGSLQAMIHDRGVKARWCSYKVEERSGNTERLVYVGGDGVDQTLPASWTHPSWPWE